MIRYTTLDKIFTKFQRDYGYSDLNEADVIEWAAEALGAINAIPNLEEVVKFFQVKNYQIKLPNELTKIQQIIKINNSVSSLCNCLTELSKEDEIITTYSEPPTDTENTCDIKEKNCNTIIFSNLPSMWYSYHGFDYDVIKLSTSTFKRSYDCTKNGNFSCNYEYTIINGEYIRFNFTDSEIALSYYKMPLDNNGFPLIPDTYAYSNAIVKYIMYKLMERRFYSGEPNSVQKYEKAERDWNKYCSQAASESMIPKGIDEMENLTQMWLRPIQGRSYNNLSTTLGKEQKLKH